MGDHSGASSVLSWARRTRNRVLLPWSRRRTDLLLGPRVAGRRVLVMGSGTSVRALGEIPDDVAVFTCKAGICILAERSPPPRVEVYSCFRSGLSSNADLVPALLRVRTHFFMSNDLGYVRRRRDLDGAYSVLLRDVGDDNHLLTKLIAPRTLTEIRGRAVRAKTSSGIRLLQYALHYGAREIYVAGVDFGRDGYAWPGEAQKRWNHEDIDENFVRLMGERHRNVFSATAESPIAEYFAHRDLRSEEDSGRATSPGA